MENRPGHRDPGYPQERRKEAHSSNEVLLARPIPSQEEVATYRKSEIRVGILGQDLDDATKGLEEMKVALTAKQEAWRKQSGPNVSRPWAPN